MTSRGISLLSIPEEAAACRVAWAGIAPGALGWHIHHNLLAEPLVGSSAEDRIAHILAGKPETERALRLRLMRPVRDVAAIASARVAYGAAIASAQAAFDAAITSAWAAYDAAIVPARAAYAAAVASAQAAHDAVIAPARVAYGAAIASAWAAHEAAIASARVAYGAAIAPIHARECPGCPWDGETIFGGGYG